MKAAISKALPSATNGPVQKTFQYADYEDIDHERLLSDQNYLANSYTYRKGLIRKHYLAHTIEYYVAKHPDSVLAESFPETFQFEIPYAEALDDVLDEVWDLRCELVENESLKRTFILKPSMSDKGQGIRLFKTIDQLQAIFDAAEEDEEDEDTAASQLRHFVVQEYMPNPLLLEEYDNRKFHIRTYVLCVGSLKVFVYERMLMLFSEKPFQEPVGDSIAMEGHLTNTCLQQDTEQTVVVEFDRSALSASLKGKIRTQINEIVHDLFDAAITVDRINFQPLPNAFETYGLDFIVNTNGLVQLLEVNAYPDFKQTGDDLKGLIYELFDGVMAKAVVPFFEGNERDQTSMVPVFELDTSFR